MDRFFFHLDEGGVVLEDFEGTEMPDLAAARRSAVQAARGMMAHDIEKGWLCLDYFIEIANADGLCLQRVTFADVVSISGGPIMGDVIVAY